MEGVEFDAQQRCVCAAGSQWKPGVVSFETERVKNMPANIHKKPF